MANQNQNNLRLVTLDETDRANQTQETNAAPSTWHSVGDIALSLFDAAIRARETREGREAQEQVGSAR